MEFFNFCFLNNYNERLQLFFIITISLLIICTIFFIVDKLGNNYPKKKKYKYIIEQDTSCYF